MPKRMTLSTRNLEAVVANLRQYHGAALNRVKAEVQEFGDRVYARAQDLCPRDTGFMAEHMIERFTDAGFGVEIGWEARDFLNAGLDFYPIYVVFGTSRTPAQDPLFPARDAELPAFRRRLKEALKSR